MFDESRIKIDDLLKHSATLKVILALADVGQAYQFQLTRITGHHSRMLGEALDILMMGRIIKVVQGRYVSGTLGISMLSLHMGW